MKQTICDHLCNYLEGITRNISVKLFCILTSSSGDVDLRYFLSRALAPLLLYGAKSFV